MQSVMRHSFGAGPDEQLIPDPRSSQRPAHAVEKKIRDTLGMLPVSHMRMEAAVRRPKQ